MSPIRFLVLALMLPCAGVDGADIADWPANRQNGTLDGHSPAKGGIVSPKIAWSCYVGQERSTVLAEPGEPSGPLDISKQELPETSDILSDDRWGLKPRTGEVGGKRQSVEKTSSVLYADIFEETPGLEKIEIESEFNTPIANNGQRQKAKARCLAWKENAWQTVWETPPFDLLFLAMPLSGDFDQDGQLEIAFLPWCELIILDAKTGAVKYRCKFTEARSYGFFGHYDLDGDGRSEFVVQADFCKHVDVLGFRDGELKLLWRREIEPDISNPQKILRVNPNPVADVDGDKKMEVAVCTQNDSLSNGWQVDIYDGCSGVVKYSLPNAYLEGLVDLDGDGVAEVLISPTSSMGVSNSGPAQVFAVRSGVMQKLWEGAGLAWQRWEPPTYENVNSGATLAKRTALCRADPAGAVAVLKRPADRSVLSVRWVDGRFVPMTDVASAATEVLSVSRDGAMLMSASKTGSISSASGKLTAICRQKSGIPAAPVSIVHPKNSDKPIVVAQGTGEELVLFHPASPQTPMQEIRRVVGRSQGANWPNSLGPVCADLAGDGNDALLYATTSENGQARMVAEDVVSGNPIWKHDFAEIPDTAPIWNSGGIVLWQAGHFTNAKTRDVLVTVRRSMMHSEETCLLSGADGTELWRRNRQIAHRGVGGTPFAIADFDGDGLDDAASFHPNLFYILKGAAGADILAKEASWEQTPSRQIYWGMPVAIQRTAGGPASVLMAGVAMTGLLEPNGNLLWCDALDKSKATFALGDFDGDGQQEVLGAGYEDGIRCYDIEQGTVKWTLPLPMPETPVGAASADINGDGRDEAVFSSGTTVYAIGTRPEKPAGEMLWSISMPAIVGPPCIASLSASEGTGIFVVGADGNVFCIKD